MYYIYHPYDDLTFCIRELGQNVKNAQILAFKRPPVTFMALPIHTHIPNLKGLSKIFFKLSRPKENLCGGLVTILNPKYP